MGTLVDAEVDGGRGADASNAGEISASDPVVYQLVRVEGDGSLVPATDDEVVEVENLLEDDKSELLSIEAMRCNEGCVYALLSSKKSDLEGISPSKNTNDDSHMSDARLEEERLRLSRDSVNHSLCESLGHSPKYKNVVGQSSDCAKHSQSSNDKLQPDNASLETAPAFTGLNGNHSARLETVETCSDLANEAVASRSPASETCTSSQPDFSILKGEICFDDLSIRGLQEAFRATFGRRTSVKDKLWLKRRIAMGLTNSCDIPTTSFVIKENKIIHKKVIESNSMVQKNFYETGVLLAGQVSDDNCRDSPTNLTDQIGDHQVVSGNKPIKPRLEYDIKDENLQMEQCGGKRVRKPTRRYIEELSDVETRECTGRLVPSEINSGLGRSSSKSRIRPVCDIGSLGTTFVTRQDSLGGYEIRIPYVSRVRRGRPRKNFMAFLNFVNMERGKVDIETTNSEEQDLDHGQLNSAGDNSDNNADIVPSLKGVPGRKHHRAWTLSEVLKLVEGVARYGAGRWSEIRRVAFSSYSYRTSVDLKDKWRNLLRASFTQGSTQKAFPLDSAYLVYKADPIFDEGKALCEHSDKIHKLFETNVRDSRKFSSMPIPKPILLRVRELAEMQHSQPGFEVGPGNSAGHAGRLEQEKGSGFL